MKKSMLIFMLAVSVFSFDRVIPQSTGNQTAPEADKVETFLREVTLTSSGLTHFFKCYNSSFYTEKFLPCCFLHLTDLLAYTPKQGDPYGFVCSVFGIFLDRVKGCAWVNPFALIRVLEDMPRLLEPLARERVSHDGIRNEIKKIAAAQTHLLIEQNFDGFVEELSLELNKYVQKAQAVRDFQDIVLVFLHTTLDRLVWDVHDPREAWAAFKTLGNDLAVLYEKNIIADLDCLNQVLWALTYRFNYFLDLCGTTISIDWYAQVRKELETLDFMRLEEKEKLRRTKLQVLTKALRFGEAKARAYQQYEIITDALPDKTANDKKSVK